MADFEVKVYKLTIEEHPNADLLEIARVGDYRSIVGKGQFKTGDLGVYIPEQAVCPAWLIEELGLTGKLAGKAKNRVKAIKLRGILSQGLVYPVDVEWETVCTVWNGGKNKGTRWPETTLWEGDDLTEFLDITKYEPVIPTSMSGEVEGASGCTIKYDIENIKKYPDTILDGENVSVTEKLHGTWCCFGSHPNAPYVVSSKGLSARGLIFQINTENTERNLYVRTLEGTRDEDGYNLIDRFHLLLNTLTGNPMLPFYILGEIFGKGVQDLHYGLQSPSFRVFDVYIGEPGQGRYLDPAALADYMYELGVETVPVLFQGPFSKDKIEELTNGKETINGHHVREGVVIKPLIERNDEELGRVILKSVSEDYLLRRGNITEYN